MYKIPRVIPPRDDELLVSWLLRLAKENGFESTKSFLNAYIFPNEVLPHSVNMKMDFRLPFEYLWRSLPHDIINERDLFFRTSTFTGIAPFFTQEQRQRYINQAFNVNTMLEPLFPSPHSTLESLYLCPECAKREIEMWGFFIFRRSHHLPGVKACHIHGCALGRITDDYMRLSIDEMPTFKEETVSNLAQAVNYARFSKEFMDAEFDFSITNFFSKVLSRMTDSVVNDMVAQKIDYLSNEEIQKLREVDPKYVNHKSMLAAIQYLYKSVEAFKKDCQQDKQEQLSIKTLLPSNEFELVGDYRNDLIMVRHKLCGEISCTSPYGFKIGWRCAVCDRATTLQEKFKSLVDAVGEGAYEPMSAFLSMDKRIELRHLVCGKTFSTKARAFLNEGVRCECKRRIYFEDAERNVEQYDGFTLVSYEQTDRPMTVKHSCGGAFEIYYSKFFERPHCRVCERKGHLNIRTTEDFKRDMQELVGSEYSLIGEYNGPHAYLLIKHNVCGNTQKYRPYYFLDGGRCSICHEETTEEEFTSYVHKYSKGKYSVLRKATKNLYEILDNTDGHKVRLSRLRILQELHRPTLSPVLPLEEKDEEIKPREGRTSDRIMAWLRDNYADEPIFMEDIQIDGVSKETKQSTLANLATAGKLIHITTGVYGFQGKEYSIDSVIEAKYLLCHNTHIGFYRGKFFAYKIGLTDVQPELSIATNKESVKTPVRKITFLGVPIHIKGVPEKINNNNYLILAVIDFLIQYKQCTQKSTNEVLDAVRDYIMANNHGEMLPYSAFEPYVQSYKTENIRAQMRNIIGKLCREERQ